ncbi:MAG TPA: hypothetical protein VG982_03295 [Candidatus Paceibacterota bacterium]|nr:hypothetical protein [Candidatus Paceibacterota bacterium]
MHRKKIHLVQTLLVLAVSIVLIIGIVHKLSHQPSTIAFFTQMHLENFVQAFALIEIIIVLTLLWHPTRMISVLVGSAYFGAGVIMLLSINQSPILPAATLIALWLIQKLNWWNLWRHGYNCGCKMCSTHRGESLDGKEWCNCKPGCPCEKGMCNCSSD